MTQHLRRIAAGLLACNRSTFVTPMPLPYSWPTAIRTFATLKLPEAPEYCSTCIFPTEWAEVPLIAKKQYNHDSSLFTFGLPEGRSLSLPVCACLLLRGMDSEGKDAVRPYTPISTNEVTGSFDLLVKVYEDGLVSKWLDGLPADGAAMVGFKHIPFNIKQQYPFGKTSITMLAGGTGITPMYQALQLLAHKGDKTQVTLIYGNKSPQDILLRDEIDELAAKSDGRIKVVYVVGESPDQGPIDGWGGELGWVDKAKFEKYAAPASEDTLIMVCGLPAMYDTFCGPRGEKELKDGSILHALGYTDSMVAKL